MPVLNRAYLSSRYLPHEISTHLLESEIKDVKTAYRICTDRLSDPSLVYLIENREYTPGYPLLTINPAAVFMFADKTVFTTNLELEYRNKGAHYILSNSRYRNKRDYIFPLTEEEINEASVMIIPDHPGISVSQVESCFDKKDFFEYDFRGSCLLIMEKMMANPAAAPVIRRRLHDIPTLQFVRGKLLQNPAVIDLIQKNYDLIQYKEILYLNVAAARLIEKKFSADRIAESRYIYGVKCTPFMFY
jgi:hypothetical protein